ncbi:glycosyltransferase [Candidatus Woesearchaeota archaeon]|nr:glycosyltransferase [Candidatus Woesearchaeota archaeon]
MMLSVVIAIYNEEKNVKELTLRLIKTLNSLKIPFEIIYIVEGEDQSINILKQLQKKEKRLRLFYSKKPSGLGRAFKTGFCNIRRDSTHILTLDADLNHQPEEIPYFFKLMKKQNADMVIGSRFVSGGSIDIFPWHKRIVSRFTNVLVEIVTGIKAKDKTSNYRLYTRQALNCVVNKMKFPGFETVVEMLLITAKNKFRIAETPIQFKWRVHGESKLNMFKTAIGYFKLFLRISSYK